MERSTTSLFITYQIIKTQYLYHDFKIQGWAKLAKRECPPFFNILTRTAIGHYRRFYAQGGVYFFTVVTNERKPILCSEFAIKRLKASFNYVSKKYPFKINSLVILPDHLHCIWQLPETDSDFSLRWSMIKRYFSLGMKGEVNCRREKSIWQKRFWEHCIRDEDDHQRCLDYIYYNPVKHGYVDSPKNWPYSTFKRAVSQGLYELDWGCIEPVRIKYLEME